MDKSEIGKILFERPISTRSEVTDISGHGLGLYTVGEEVRKHGGQINVTTNLKQGTQMKIILPYYTDFK